MKRFGLMMMLVLGLCATAMSQTGDLMRFELTPVVPPVPALKYELLFDGAFDRIPGNAAVLYLDSILLMGRDSADKAEKALEAYHADDMSRFYSLAGSLEHRPLMDELELAGRREDCDWGSPFHEMGDRTLLPQLAPLRDLGRLLEVRALRQIEQGKVDDALKTVRLGYELSDKVGREHALIAGLVSLSITSMMDDCLERLMNRPDAPNLYWALGGFPSRRSILCTSLDGESQSWINAVPNLAKAWVGEDLSTEQWQAVFDYLGEMINTPHQSGPDAVREISPDLMRQAQEQYAQTHHITPQQAAAVDPVAIVGTFYLSEFQIARDNVFRLRGLAYPAQLVMSKTYSDDSSRLRREQPGNLFLQVLPDFHRALWRFAETDRRHAALTAVEAIRSYAAANGGALPNQLSEITDTPVPLNPATGGPFEYRVNGDTATLSDSRSESRLTYTIRIHK